MTAAPREGKQQHGAGAGGERRLGTVPVPRGRAAQTPGRARAVRLTGRQSLNKLRSEREHKTWGQWLEKGDGPRRPSASGRKQSV